MVTRDEVEKVLRALVGQVFPMLTGLPYAIKGRVTNVYDQGRRADVQVLDATGNAMASWPVLARLPVPANGTAEIGRLVRVGFYYADPSQPYIDEVLA